GKTHRRLSAGLLRGPLGEERDEGGLSMTEFLKSLIRCSWALSLFSVEQLAHTLSSLDAGRSAQALEAVARAAEGRFRGEVKAVFQAGDRLQRGLVDQIYDSLTPSGMLRLTLDALQQSAATFSRLSPGRENRFAWRELQRKLRAFSLFEHVDTALDL